jgi:hypothetical protein
VNPNRKTNVDKRTLELLDLIKDKGREVAEAIALLRTLTTGQKPSVRSSAEGRRLAQRAV